MSAVRLNRVVRIRGRTCRMVILAASGLLLAAAPAHAANGLVAPHSFDDGTGAALSDSSGNGKSGTVVGGTWVAGRFGSALSFDGTRSRVDLPALGTFYKAGFTLEGWVKKSGTKKDV